MTHPEREEMAKAQPDYRRACATLATKKADGMYGKITFHLQGGRIVREEVNTTALIDQG